MNQFIIGLSGRKGSGKDYTARLLSRLGWTDGHHVERLAFADALKDEVAKACGVDRIFIEENKEALRPLLQFWGTGLRRNLFGLTYWLDRADAALEKITSPIVCVTDVRFPNEAQWVKDRGGIMVRVVNQEVDDGAVDTHSSEISLDNYEFDHHVFNTGRPQEYADEIGEFWNNVVLPKVNEIAAAER